MPTPTKAELLALLQAEKLGSPKSDAIQQYVLSTFLDKNYDTETVSRIIHTPGITPSTNSTIPGGGPEPIAIGTLLGLHFKRDTDLVYSYSKIQSSFLADASFHVHWTKAVDTNQAGATVRWRLRYTVFNGISQDLIAGPTGTIIWDDTYDDSGTTSRIVYRTPNIAATGFVANYYVGFELGFVAANTTLANRPVVISCDILSRNSINEGN